jgi:GntR family transcriptional regulator
MIAAAIIDGTYADGGALPSVRSFAVKQAANPLAVAKAYQQFQLDGLVGVQRGVGMFVAKGAEQRLKATERAMFMQDEWPRLRKRLRILGIDPAELLAEA